MMNWRIAVLGALLLGEGVLADSPSPVAGLEPASRPAGAPRIVVFEQTPAWKAQALRGIGAPHTGLGFLADQGAWYTPFDRPNAPGPYDLRGLYRDAARRD